MTKHETVETARCRKASCQTPDRDPMSSRPLRPLILSLGLFAAVSLALSGCGRKGDLDVPSTPVEKLNKRGVDSNPPVKDRPFVLDPLL